jgi:periplasmic protein TonB
MHAEVHANPVTHRDRLVTTLSFALLLHALVILGVTFTASDDESAQGERALEIVLVSAPSDEPPEKADYLADSAQRGAGNIDERTRARSPETALGDPNARETRERGESPLLGEFTERDAEDNRPRASRLPDPVIATTRDDHLRFAVEVRSGGGTATPTAYGTDILLPSIPADTDAHTALAYSENPRERFISVNTEEALYAAYLHSWRERVERVGNLNYPDQARRQGLRGALELEVALGPDGNVRQLRVRNGSGHRLLDDAAMRIVYMASPFPPFPEDLRREVDLLRFAFVWEFGDDVGTTSVWGTSDDR